MAFLVTSKFWALALALLCIFVFGFYPGRAYDEDPEAGGAGGGEVGTGVEGEGAFGEGGAAGGGALDGSGGGGVGGGGGGAGSDDPPEIVAKALLCLDDKHIYSSCEETCRLTASGYLDIPPEYTDEFCRGPCLKETHLVLHCIENILHNFRFYNKATVRDVRDTIDDGCAYGPKRGDFNVVEHIEEEENRGRRDKSPLLVGTVLMIVASALFI